MEQRLPLRSVSFDHRPSAAGSAPDTWISMTSIATRHARAGCAALWTKVLGTRAVSYIVRWARPKARYSQKASRPVAASRDAQAIASLSFLAGEVCALVCRNHAATVAETTTAQTLNCAARAADRDGARVTATVPQIARASSPS